MIFRKKKYCFNQDTLTFDEIKHDRNYRVKYILVVSSICIVFGSAFGYLLRSYVLSPKEMILTKRVSLLQQDMQQLWIKSKDYESMLQANFFASDNKYRTILGIDTLPLSMRYGGTGGSAEDEIITFNSDLDYQLEKQIDKLDIQLQIQRNSFSTIYEKTLEQTERWKRLPVIQPVAQYNVLYVSSYYGMRTDPFNHVDEQNHTGIDFVAEYGVNVYATADGTVTLSHFSRTGYGNEIVIDHAFGYSSRYAHLQEILVNEGTTVKRGQLIGKVGSSGRSTGPHLHYEVRYEHKAVNPIFYIENNLNPDDYQKIIALANDINQ